MAEELDVNKIVVEFVNHHIEHFYSTSAGIFKGAADAIRLRLNRSYKEYLICAAERYSKAKSFFIRNEPTNLYAFYVPMDISCGDKRIARTCYADIVSGNTRSVITGTGGSGKSMLMRHLFLDALINKHKVPLFLELRRLNTTKQTLLDFAKETLRANHFTLDYEYIDKAIEAGHFAFLVDGFDELSTSLRKSVSRQILQLAAKYDKNHIIVSSRPDNEFAAWQAFTVFHIDALTLDQACDLVNRLPFDPEVKSKFHRDLQNSLFEEHKSFLSNPLLLSIMLLTYGENADIPKKLNVFYNQAYEALFQRHDAYKGAYQRERQTNLDIQDFGKVFSVFSLQTYDKRTFQMPKSDALTFLENCRNILVDIDFDAHRYLQDAQQAVCLLIEDGLLITFAHRSFQEYFVARFIASSKPEIQQKLIKKYAVNSITDSVLSLLYEMNPELVEREFIVPGIEEIEKSIKLRNKLGITHYWRFLTEIVEGFDTGYGHMLPRIRKHRWLNLTYFAIKVCGKLVGIKSIPVYNVNYRKHSDRYTETKFMSIKEFRMHDDLIVDVATNGGLLSKPILQKMLDLKPILVEKHEESDDSLERILTA